MRTCQRPKFIPMKLERHGNSKKMKDAIEKAFKELNSLSPEELTKELDKHKDGDIAKILMESGAIDVIMDDLKKKGIIKEKK